MRRFALITVCCWMLSTASAFAQPGTIQTQSATRQLNWAEQMLDKQSHDFGYVARGAEVVYRIKITNKYKEVIHLSGARTSCNCISVRLSNNTLRTWEEAYLEVKLNTLQYKGERNVNAYVTVDQPAYQEITIPIHAYIRTDVVIEPGSALLGNVAQGESGERRLRIDYAGSFNWRILEARTRNPYLQTSVRELSRIPNGATANISYEISVKLSPDAAPGEIRDQLVLITNDQNAPQIPVLVDGRVMAEYSVTPSAIALETVRPGDEKRVQIVIRGLRPFSVEKIESNSGSNAYQVLLPPKDRQQIVQILKVIVKAPETPGPLEEVFTVTVAGQGAGVRRAFELKLSGKVLGTEVPKTATQTSGTVGQTVITAKPPVMP